MNSDDTDGYKSRSQKKRESTSAQKTGAALAALSKGDLENLDLPPALLEAILAWKAFPGHEAKRRQMQYIGRVMRDMDLPALEEKLEAFLVPDRAATKALHELEALRDSLVNADDKTLETELHTLAARYPAAPVARLRHLSVTARNERAGKKPPKAYRELFRLLRELAETSGNPET